WMRQPHLSLRPSVDVAPGPDELAWVAHRRKTVQNDSRPLTTVPSNTSRFLRPHQVEAIYGLSRKFLAHARWRGDGPPFCKASGKLVLYAVDDIERWLAARRRRSTSDRGTTE